MINGSYFYDEIKNIRQTFGEENILVGPERECVIIKGIDVPQSLSPKTGKGDVCLMIPDGFGFGINILTCFIYLPVTKLVCHLWENQLTKKELNEIFGNIWKDRKSEWHWICFHPMDSQGKIIDGYTGPSTEIMRMRELVYMISIVLKKISDNDEEFMRLLQKMTKNREKLLKNHENDIKFFMETLEWSTFRWPNKEETCLF